MEVSPIQQEIGIPGETGGFSGASDTDGIPTVADLMDNPLAQYYITLAANDCGYSGTAEELIVSYVRPFF